MADTGWLDLTSFSTSGGAGSPWTNTSNAAASDNSHATCTTGGAEDTEFLGAQNLDGSVPAGATIDGIEVRIEKKANNTAVTDNAVKLVIGGVGTGDNKASGSNWPASDAYTTYGGPTDLWGTTPSAADVNANDFGCAISGHTTAIRILSVDHIQMKIYYTESAGGNTSNFFFLFGALVTLLSLLVMI